MKFIDAAAQILAEEGKPLHFAEIIDLAIDRELITTSGKTPHHTLGTRVWEDIKKHGEKSRFVMVGAGRINRRVWLRGRAVPGQHTPR